MEAADEAIDIFVRDCEKRQKALRLRRMRFAARMVLPALSKAFFTWKFASRQKVDTASISSGMFSEPKLRKYWQSAVTCDPLGGSEVRLLVIAAWNVRHPRSSFTSSWESVQGGLLVYIAFSVCHF